MRAFPAPLLRYGVALLACTLALVLTLLLRSLTEQSVAFLFLASVMISAWYGGLGPGLLATAVATSASVFMALPSASTPVGVVASRRAVVRITTLALSNQMPLPSLA